MIINENQDEILDYLKDASNLPGGRAARLLIPESESEIRQAMREATASRTPVTISGAGTGLAGGRVPFGGDVLSMARMNRVVSIDAAAMRAVVEPGVILGELQTMVEQEGAFYPPDPTERSAQIGGTVATNASGARTFKYGPTREYITAARIVLPTGELLALRRGDARADGRRLVLHTDEGRPIELELPGYTMPAVKHAAGYFVREGMDAVDLFIGSEGTLGVFTEIELKLIPLPEGIFSGVVFFPDEDATLDFVEEARATSRENRGRGELLEARALEFVDANALDFIRSRVSGIPDAAAGGAIWFEQEITSASEERLLGEWYEMILRHRGLAEESWFAAGTEDQRRLREFRHAVPSAVYEYISEHGQTKLGTDMAVPDDTLRGLLAFYRSEFARAGIRHITYGHIGNSHLHANMFADGESEVAAARAVYRRLIERALELGGTISAEHGVGKLKPQWLEKMYGAEAIEAMRRVKRVLDPAMVLGIGTMFTGESGR
jgi:D-lactate dehydrogenase (cytochrome)